MSLPDRDQVNPRWKQQAGAAKALWGRLTDEELMQAQGHVEKLGELLAERYALSKEAAGKRVTAFFDALPPATPSQAGTTDFRTPA